MTSLTRVVPIALCLSSVMVLSGCDGADEPVARVTPVNQSTVSESKPSAAPAVAAKPADQAAPAPATTPPARSPHNEATSTADANPSFSNVEPPADGKPPRTPVTPKPVDPAAYIVKAVPPEVDLGEMPTHDSKKGTVRLVNTSDRPMTVVSHRASCGCTTLKLTPNTVIAPKGELELEVQMSTPARSGPVSKTVTFVVEGQPDLIVPVKGVAKAFVISEPANLDPKQGDGKFVIKSVDGVAFRIISSQPAVLADFDKEAKPEHDLTMLFDKYREVGITRQTVLFLDHPKCPQVVIPVNFDPQEVAAEALKRRQKQSADQDAIKEGMKDRTELADQPAAPVDADTLLVNLIKERKTSEVLQRIATGLDVNYRDNTGTSLLSLAGKYGNVELIQALLATKNVQIESADNAGRTPLMHAATSKNVEAVRALLDAQAQLETRDAIGGTALTWAAGLGDAATVKELITAGAQVDVVGAVTGWTPLIWAAGFGDPMSIEPLVDAHAELETADFLQGATPLIHAARTGKLESVTMLIKKGAPLETADRNGNTPLLAAAGTAGGTAEKIKALIDAGADIHAKDNRGLSALDLAQKRTDMRAAEVIKLLEPLLGGTPKPAEQPAGSATGAGH